MRFFSFGANQVYKADGNWHIIYKYKLYYYYFVQPSVESSTVHRITSTGVEGVLFNGVPDWIYEGTVFNSVPDYFYVGIVV